MKDMCVGRIRMIINLMFFVLVFHCIFQGVRFSFSRSYQEKVNWQVYPVRQSLLCVTYQDLIEVPRIGSVYAMRILQIIQDRYRQGQSKLSWKDVISVKGIGSSTLEQLQRFFYL